MKKIYSKPAILFEDFQMSTNIAGSCDYIVGNPSKGTCAVMGTGGIAVFDSSVGAACVYKPEDMGFGKDMYDKFCYHVPIETSDLFNS